jgi:hypothetical protein
VTENERYPLVSNTDTNFSTHSTYPFTACSVWLCLGPFVKLRKAIMSSIISVCPSALNNLAPTGRIYVKFDTSTFRKICQENSSFIKIGQKITDTLREDLCTFMISDCLRLRMGNVSDKIYSENDNTYFMSNKFFHKILPFMR